MQEAVGNALDRRWMLCLLLMLERARGKQSSWAQYIDVLPRTYSESSHRTALAVMLLSNAQQAVTACMGIHTGTESANFYAEN